MSGLFDTSIARGGALAFLALVFGATYIFAKGLAAAVDRDKLRAEMRLAAAEKRARIVCDVSRCRLVTGGGGRRLTIPVSNDGKSMSVDVWVRLRWEPFWLGSPKGSEAWQATWGAGEERLFEVELGESDAVSNSLRLLIEISYRDYGEVERREWQGHRLTVTHPPEVSSFRVGTLRRMLRFGRLRAWRI